MKSSMTPEQLAQIAYKAWCDVMSCKTKTITRGWDVLSDAERTAWRVAVVAVKANVLSGFTKVGE